MDKQTILRITAHGLLFLLLGKFFFSQQSVALSAPGGNPLDIHTYRPSQTAIASALSTPNCPESYIELLVDKPEVKVGERFELTAIYHNLGQPWVYSVGFNPQGLAVVDPPFDPPCKLCKVFQLRAVSVGRVEMGLCATGEIYCNGWMWSGACSKVPAVVEIVPAVIYLPIVIH